MHKIRRLTRNWRDTTFWTDEASPYLRRLPRSVIYGLYSRAVHGESVHVVDEDWDTLIILDACRFDVFSEINWLEGELDSKISKGCVTGRFLRKNFTDKYPDTVYVSANPHAPKYVPDRFHDFVPVSETHWDEDLNTVPPDVMTDALR